MKLTDRSLRDLVRDRGYKLKVHHVTDPEVLAKLQETRKGPPPYATYAGILDEDGDLIDFTWAICSPSDNPNRKLGRRIALRRLFHRLGWHDLERAT